MRRRRAKDTTQAGSPPRLHTWLSPSAFERSLVVSVDITSRPIKMRSRSGDG